MLKCDFREYRTTDWIQIEDIILQAENFGPKFIESEKKRIDAYIKCPDIGKILLLEHKEEKQIVGFAVIELKWRSINIVTMITHCKYLRQGIGRNLIDHIRQIGEEDHNFNVITVDTGDFMEYAQVFYLSCGFQISGYVSHSMSWYNHQVFFAMPLKGLK